MKEPNPLLLSLSSLTCSVLRLGSARRGCRCLSAALTGHPGSAPKTRGDGGVLLSNHVPWDKYVKKQLVPVRVYQRQEDKPTSEEQVISALLALLVRRKESSMIYFPKIVHVFWCCMCFKRYSDKPLFKLCVFSLNCVHLKHAHTHVHTHTQHIKPVSPCPLLLRMRLNLIGKKIN